MWGWGSPKGLILSQSQIHLTIHRNQNTLQFLGTDAAEPISGFQSGRHKGLAFYFTWYKQYYLLLLVQTPPMNWFLLPPLWLTEHISTFGSWILEQDLPPLALIRRSGFQWHLTQFYWTTCSSYPCWRQKKVWKNKEVTWTLIVFLLLLFKLFLRMWQGFCLFLHLPSCILISVPKFIRGRAV